MKPATTLSSLYGTSLSLLTDLYQLTMAYGYWKQGLAEQEAVFHLFFRKNPFGGGYAVAAGLEHAVAYLEQLTLSADDIAYLATLTGNDDQPLFEQGFLDYLADMRFTCDVDAMPEGTLAFPHEPLIRVRGPLIQAQLVETPLLNMVNFQTLIATKAARICDSAQGEPVLEFGLRRAQGIDGGLSASRAAYIGGCSSTSNVLAGKLYGIPVKGTHAHSWVMSFATEREAFEAYAAAMPNNCVFLVDTYDTLEGVKAAIEVGLDLRARGYEMVGVRLDSGDLAALSIGARELLDAGGFPDAAIIASNDLSESIITSLKQQGATIGVWGVGTKLATAFDQPALGGVYKLAAIRPEAGGAWVPKVKLSNQPIKVSNPGIQGVRRYTDGDGNFVGDVIVEEGIVTLVEDESGIRGIDVTDHTREVSFSGSYEELLVPVFRQGARVYELPTLPAVAQRCREQLGHLSGRTRRHVNPHTYDVALESGLQALKLELIQKARRN